MLYDILFMLGYVPEASKVTLSYPGMVSILSSDGPPGTGMAMINKTNNNILLCLLSAMIML